MSHLRIDNLRTSSSGCNVEELGRKMELSNSFIPTGHRYSFADTKRYNSTKAADLDNGDFLAIDDLLDFSNEDIGGPIEPVHSNESSSSTPSEAKVGCDSSLDSKQSLSIFETDAAGELCVPCDDLAELEWLSNFVEESFSSGDASASIFSSCVHAADLDEKKGCRKDSTHFQITSPVSVLESDAYSEKLGVCFSPEMSVPGRARSKRCRTAVCFWNTRILSGDASASILETSSTSTVTGGDPHSSDSDFAYEHRGADSSSGKKHCNFNNASKGKKGQDAAQARTCLHCGTQRTPQWRAGPAGPKTLCNACGVRFKSGRLFPEYRPAASPTFIESIHSNSHRKVLEMRKQRDAVCVANSNESSCNSDNGDDEWLLNE